MIEITKIILPLTVVAGSDSVLITDVSQVKNFVDGKPTDKIWGYKYKVVCPSNKYCQFDIKIEQPTPTITPQELEAKGGTVKAKLKGFIGKFYKNRNGEYQFTAKATGIEVIA